MAYQITGPVFGHFIAPADMIKTVADATDAANANFAQIARGARYAFVRVYLKTFAIGTAAQPTQFVIEAASDAGFTTDLISAGLGLMDLTDEGSALIICHSPLKALDFWRVRTVFNGTATGTYDAELVAIA